MIRAVIAEERVFQSWLDYQHALTRAIAPLTPQQLQLRPLPGRRAIGEIAEHIVYGRALHLHRALEHEAVELVPYLRWDGTAEPPQVAEAIVRGLEITWSVIVRTLRRGSASEDVPQHADAERMQAIWGLLDHDLPHAGQLSLLLRASGLPGVDI
jgi:hypothetical protein